MISFSHLIKSKTVWVILALLVVGGGYWGYKSYAAAKAAVPRYRLTAVTKGTIVTSISGSGQVAGNRELDVKPKASGQITKILVKVGQHVSSTMPLMELDRTDANKTIRDALQAVRDANVSLTTARLQFQKTKQAPDAVSLTQAQNTLAKAQRDLETLKNSPTTEDLSQAQADVTIATTKVRMSSDGVMPQVVRDAYDTYVATLQSTSQTLDKILADAESILGTNSAPSKDPFRRLFSTSNEAVKTQAQQAFNTAKITINAVALAVGALAQHNEQSGKIESAATQTSDALQKTVTMLSAISEGLRYTVTAYNLTQSEIDSFKSTIDSDRTSANGKVTAVLNQTQAILSARDSFTTSQIAYQKALDALHKIERGTEPADLATAEERVREAAAQLKKLQAGTDPVDLQLAQISVDQRATALTAVQIKLNDAQVALNDYTVRAPFDGIVAKIPLQVSEDAGAGTAVVTLETAQQMATISLNEVDVAKIQVGQKATLTFDAIDGFGLTGEVAEISPIGTVTQGVVSYDVKVAFDTQDPRVKSGMSVSVSIITKVATDVLTVPNGAIKTQGTQSYVETLDVPSTVKPDATTGLITSSVTPKQIAVQIGDSNDTVTEITSGLQEGQQIIAQTIKTSTTATAASSANSLLRMGGAATGGAARGGFGGGAPPGR